MKVRYNMAEQMKTANHTYFWAKNNSELYSLYSWADGNAYLYLESFGNAHDIAKTFGGYNSGFSDIKRHYVDDIYQRPDLLSLVLRAKAQGHFVDNTGTFEGGIMLEGPGTRGNHEGKV